MMPLAKFRSWLSSESMLYYSRDLEDSLSAAGRQAGYAMIGVGSSTSLSLSPTNLTGGPSRPLPYFDASTLVSCRDTPANSNHKPQII